MLMTPETYTDSPQIHGRKVEINVATKLRTMGFVVFTMPTTSRFDLLVDDKRVEVKGARFGLDQSWGINIHRHGAVDESSVDAYIVVLSDVPASGPMPIYLVIPAPVGVPTIRISMPTLIRKYAKYVDNWEYLRSPKSA